jgi:hypothetical protein
VNPDPVGAAAALVALELEVAGVAHVTDPRDLVAPGVLVGLPDASAVITKRGQLVDVPIPVSVVSVPPYNADAAAWAMPTIGAVLAALSAPDARVTFTQTDPPTWSVLAVVTVGPELVAAGAAVTIAGTTWRISTARLTPTVQPAAHLETLGAAALALGTPRWALELSVAPDWAAAPSLCRALLAGAYSRASVTFELAVDGATFTGTAVPVPPPVLAGTTDAAVISLPVTSLEEASTP